MSGFTGIIEKYKQPLSVKLDILEEFIEKLNNDEDLHSLARFSKFTSQLKEFHSEWEIYANQVIQLEETLFAHWISAIENELNNVEIF